MSQKRPIGIMKWSNPKEKSFHKMTREKTYREEFSHTVYNWKHHKFLAGILETARKSFSQVKLLICASQCSLLILFKSEKLLNLLF